MYTGILSGLAKDDAGRRWRALPSCSALLELAKRLAPLTDSADRVSAGGSSFWGSQETVERPARGHGQSREILSSSSERRREASAAERLRWSRNASRWRSHLNRPYLHAFEQQ